MRTTEENISQLLRMAEHPGAYSQAQWEELLADDECRAYYEVLVKTREAFDAAQVDDLSEAEVAAEWQRFAAKRRRTVLPLRKIAAVTVGLLMLSGIAVAAVYTVQGSQRAAADDVTPTQTVATAPAGTAADDGETADEAPTSVTFDNVSLEAILTEIAQYYQVELVFANGQTKSLRLHFLWDKAQSVEQVVETLNHFEKVNITLENHKLTVG